MAEPQRDRSELVTGLETAVSTSPDNVELRLLLVGHLIEGGHHADALTHAMAVIQAQPDRVEAHRRAAHAAQAVGDRRAGAFERVARALTALDAATTMPAGASPAPSSPAPKPSAPPAAPRPAATRPADQAPDGPPPETAVPRAPLAAEPPATAPAPMPRPPAPVRADLLPGEPAEPLPSGVPAASDAVASIGAHPPTALADAPVRTRRFVSGAHDDDDAIDEIEPPSLSDPIPATPERRSRFGRRARGTARNDAEASTSEVAAPVAESPDEGTRNAGIPAASSAPEAADVIETAEDEVAEAPVERFVIAPEDVERPRLTLSDIAPGPVRDRFAAVVINPLRNGGGARGMRTGGLLLFGPDGCGKGFFARIVAGELGAGFLRVDMTDSMRWPGDPRENIGTIFEAARAAGRCVLYLDHIDRAGVDPDAPEDAADRRLLSRLASEIANAAPSRGLVVLGATTAPWKIDMTLLSSERLDRSLVVLPPDSAAREAILRANLADVPLSGVDLPWIIERTRHFSADDLVGLTDRAKDLAAKGALGDRVVVGPGEMTRAFREVRPAAPSWFTNVHENAVGGGSQEGMYDEVMSYMDANQLV